MLYLGALFLAKVLDNALSTTKTILIQRSRWVLAGIAVILADFLYFWITKRIVSADSMLALTVVAAAGGVGCSLACLVSDKLSKDRTYVNVIMSDNLEAMQAFRDFLAEHHITNVAADTYTLDWNTKTITIYLQKWAFCGGCKEGGLMAEIKTREKFKGIQALDKAAVAGERMKRAFVRSKDQAENLLDDGQISPSEYAEDKVRYMAEDTAREVGHEAGKLTGKAKSAYRTRRETQRTVNAAQQDRTRIRYARSRTIKTAEIRQRTVKQTAKSTGQATVKTAKGTVKTAQKSAKTAQQTSKAAIKTAEATAKATKAAAQTSAKAARTTAQAAKTAAKTLATAAKAAAKAIASVAKAIAAAVKALVAAIAAGGWVALIVIVIICLIAAVVVCFGIFFSSEDTGSGKPMRAVVQEINREYQTQLDDIKGSVTYDTLEMSGSRAVWPEVLSVYAVKVTYDPDNPQEVATVTPEKEQILRDIFWAMNTISHSTTTESVTTIIESDDGHGNILEETVTETKTTLHIVVSHKTAAEMAAEYGFGTQQLEHLDALLEEGTSGMWAAVLYGVYGADDQIVQVALTQVGNVGGKPYWSWYGFGSRVEWCACFVSWCANECGYIEAGVIPKFAACTSQGVPWFQERGLWEDNSYEPRPGDIIFFDWDDGGQDGQSDHVGIVEKVENGRVYTVEGNSGDSVRQNSYPIGYYEIYGYGTPAY